MSMKLSNQVQKLQRTMDATADLLLAMSERITQLEIIKNESKRDSGDALSIREVLKTNPKNSKGPRGNSSDKPGNLGPSL